MIFYAEILPKKYQGEFMNDLKKAAAGHKAKDTKMTDTGRVEDFN